MGYASPLPPFLTRSSLVVLCAVLLLPGVPGLPPGVCRAQAVPRTDTPRGGTLRLTFEPVITTWDYEFTPHGRLPIGASLPATVFVRQEQRVTPLGDRGEVKHRIAFEQAVIADVFAVRAFGLDQPALIFHGAHDDVVAASYSEEFARAHPNAILEIVDSGHELLNVLGW